MGQLTPNEKSRRANIVAHAELQLAKLYSGSGAPRISPPVTEPADAKPNEPHASREAKIKGNLFKGHVKGKIDAGYYTYNGWNYIGAPGKKNRNIYSGESRRGSYLLYKGYGFWRAECAPNFNPEYKRSDLNGAEIMKALKELDQKDDISVASRDLLRVLRAQSRKKGPAGQAIPYPFDAHHILPMEAYIKYLTMDHISIILRSSYDINTGQNMIFLPQKERWMKYHHLPAHVDNHPSYTAGLKQKFREIKDNLDDVKAKMKPHEWPEFMATKLHDLEDEEFDAIVDLGPTVLP
jgi:hypothetical protein